MKMEERKHKEKYRGNQERETGSESWTVISFSGSDLSVLIPPVSD